MKKQYIEPVMSVERIDFADVICTSGAEVTVGTGTGGRSDSDDEELTIGG